MTTITRMVQNAVHCSEFDTASNGEHRDGTCTQTSAEVCLTSALRLDPTHQAVVDRMTAMTDDMIHKGICSSNGAATVYNMAREMEAQGGTIFKECDYTQPLSNADDWQADLNTYAGIKPILMQVANAAAAFDIYGNHFNAGVQYHAIAIVGYCDDGSLVVSDPNNPGVDRDFDCYPMQALINMVPCGMIILEPTMSLPNGWNDDGTLLHAPGTQFVFKGGMRVHALAMLASGEMSGSDIPLENEHDDGSNRIVQTTSFKRFIFARNDANSPWQFFLANIGANVLADETAINNLNGTVNSLNAQVAQLTNELAAAKAPQPTPPPLPANKQALLDAAEAFIQAGKGV
jgi:hypothetical protein